MGIDHTDARPRPGDGRPHHLNLVTDQSGTETETETDPPGTGTDQPGTEQRAAATARPSEAGPVGPVLSPEEADPADPWPIERIDALLAAFRRSPWGACLTPVADDGLEAVLATPGIHAFRGAAGLPFLADCLRPATVEQHHHDLGVPLLRAVPAGLRRWVRFLDRLGDGVAPSATLTKLEYIDRLEPAWQEAVTRLDRRRRFDRPGLVSRLRELAADVGRPLPCDVDPAAAGAAEAFAAVSLLPLPDEPLQLAGLDPDTALRVLDIGDRCDHFFRLVQLIELRTAARRLLVTVAHRRPEALTRPSARNLAAAVCYAVIHGNVTRFHRYDWLGTASIAEELGASSSGIPARARALLAAAGVEQPPVDDDLPPSMRRKLLRLGDPGLLVEWRRQQIVQHAEHLLHRLDDSGT